MYISIPHHNPITVPVMEKETEAQNISEGCWGTAGEWWRWDLTWSFVSEGQGYVSYTTGHILMDNTVPQNSKCRHLYRGHVRRCYWFEWEHRWPAQQHCDHFFSNVGGIPLSKAGTIHQDTQVHPLKYAASLFLTLAKWLKSAASAISRFPCHWAKDQKWFTGRCLFSSLLAPQRPPCSGVGGREQ